MEIYAYIALRIVQTEINRKVKNYVMYETYLQIMLIMHNYA